MDFFQANCYKCLLEKNQELCTHEKEDDRAFISTWCTVEVKLALSKGYRILDLYEVWHWDEWSDELYRGYVRLFLKQKYAASGFPANIKTEQEKIDYCKRVGEKLNFELHPHEVLYNSTKRTLAKLYLNVTWGKLGQRADLSKTEYLEED